MVWKERRSDDAHDARGRHDGPEFKDAEVEEAGEAGGCSANVTATATATARCVLLPTGLLSRQLLRTLKPCVDLVWRCPFPRPVFLSGSGSAPRQRNSHVREGKSADSRLDTGILQRVLQPSKQVRRKLVDAALVGHIPTHTLGHLDRIRFRKVPRRSSIISGRLQGLVDLFRRPLLLAAAQQSAGSARGASVLHGFDRAHAAVQLDALAFVVEVFAGRFGRTGEETAHHDCGSTEGEGFGNVANVADTAVGDGRHAKAER